MLKQRKKMKKFVNITTLVTMIFFVPVLGINVFSGLRKSINSNRLINAFYKEDHNKALAILKKGNIDPNFKRTVNDWNTILRSWETLLHWAILKGNIGEVRQLLQYSEIDVNLYDILNLAGASPLCDAIYRGDMDIFNALLAHPDIKVTENRGLDPLYYAIEKGGGDVGDMDILNALLDHRDIDINLISHLPAKHSDWYDKPLTPLTWAIFIGNADAVEVLIKHPSFNKGWQLKYLRKAKKILSASEEQYQKIVDRITTLAESMR